MAKTDLGKKMAIRIADLKDVNDIAVLGTHFSSSIISESEMFNRLDYALKQSNHRVFVYEDDKGKLMGWIHACINLTLMRGIYGEILSFVVHKESRGLGIGNQLFLYTEEWIKEHHPTSVIIRSYTERERTHKFYSRYGYKNTQVALEKWIQEKKSEAVIN
ncbi:MAG: GNAT family N-acetyltransferase [Pseudomonadota bacterium]